MKKQSVLLGICAIILIAAFAFLASQMLPVLAVNQIPPSIPSDSLAQQQPRIPTPVGAATKSPLQSRALPTRTDGKPNATPTLILTTKVQIGTVVQLQKADLPMSLPLALGTGIRDQNNNYLLVARDSTGRYGVHNGADGYQSYRKLFVSDAQTGKDARLGNDAGDAFAAAVTDQYVLWWFRCYDTCESNTVKNGLYIYDFKAGSSTWLADMTNQHDLTADGRWIGYVKPTSGPGVDKPTTYAQPVISCRGDLYIYDLDTKKEQPVSSNVPWRCGPDQDFFAISNNRVVWAQADPSVRSGWALRYRDLDTGQTRTLFSPDVAEAPARLSFSGDYVVWKLRYGFDLKQNVLFNIPLTVPGWENVRVDADGSSVVKNDRVYWFKIVNGQTYYFSAPLVRSTNPYPGP